MGLCHKNRLKPVDLPAEASVTGEGSLPCEAGITGTKGKNRLKPVELPAEASVTGKELDPSLRWHDDGFGRPASRPYGDNIWII